MNALPSVDESFERLHRAGWSVGEIATAREWIVTGTNWVNVLHAIGRTQSEAWWRACEQARAVGMLGDLPPPTDARAARAVRLTERGSARARTDVSMDRTLAALLVNWWTSGERGAALVLADRLHELSSEQIADTLQRFRAATATSSATAGALQALGHAIRGED